MRASARTLTCACAVHACEQGSDLSPQRPRHWLWYCCRPSCSPTTSTAAAMPPPLPQNLTEHAQASKRRVGWDAGGVGRLSGQGEGVCRLRPAARCCTRARCGQHTAANPLKRQIMRESAGFFSRTGIGYPTHREVAVALQNFKSLRDTTSLVTLKT